jgi:broad specificity phosphatase PhoE
VIRLFLVRHGETLANRQGHVVGQSHPAYVSYL